MRTVQTIGVPADSAAPVQADAIVVALKSRTIAAADAVAQSPVCPDEVLHMALKSRNSGSNDFFTKAFAVLAEPLERTAA